MSNVIEGEFTEVAEDAQAEAVEQKERVMPFETEQMATLVAFIVALLEMPTTRNKKQLKKTRKILTKAVERSIGAKQGSEIIKNNVAATIQLVNGIRHASMDRKGRLSLFRETSDQFQGIVDRGLENLADNSLDLSALAS